MWSQFITALLGAAALSAETQKTIPMTGDASGLFLPIMGGLLGISAVLLIVYVVISKKKK